MNLLKWLLRRVPLFACLGGIVSVVYGAEPQTILLWPQGAPGAVGSEEQDKPTLTLYPVTTDRATGTSVVICPGGGYGRLALDHEGHQVARWFNSFGVSAFILKYRLGMRYHHPAPLQDVQRAILELRMNAEEWNLDPNRVGVMGFSAGGHLASTAGTHWKTGTVEGGVQIPGAELLSTRPDFMVLVYPVISFMDENTHRGSRRNLLGEEPDPVLVELLSNEKQVTAQTPPTFLIHADDDRGVKPENSILFYLALKEAGVPAELHIYKEGGHGFGLAPDDAILSNWPDRLKDWMEENRWLTPK